MPAKLSVNINKIATLRNARGGNYPDVLEAAVNCEKFGADGITVHPRPDERHITLQDVFDIAPKVKTEFNIEGYPNERFLKLIEEIKPDQATLVPDAPDVLTSENGWDTIQQKDFLKDVIQHIRSLGVRVSLFIETNSTMIENAARIGADRVEFYTGPYADQFEENPSKAIQPYLDSAYVATENSLGINAGHDLNLQNLGFFQNEIPALLEVSIGHALIADSIYLGLENTINSYKKLLQ
jgi:pyridoxine 5-phosphate synthase